MTLLADAFPGSRHVATDGLLSAEDAEIWAHAAAQGLVIVSKDADFHQRSFLYGHPPKVVWLRLGNCTTAGAEAMIRAHIADIRSFADDEASSFLELD